MNKINSFRGENYYLSNFFETPVTYDGLTYRNNEAAFQAQKTLDRKERESFCHMNPSEAKKTGRHVKLRKDWEQVKVDIMREIVQAKFEQHPELASKLIATGDCYLEEGNTWGDRTWGTVNGQGTNYLGHILMEVRSIEKERNEELEAEEPELE
jgi:ribA/ribD-fused uncharacterized protein